jgi:hypothetical protein
VTAALTAALRACAAGYYPAEAGTELLIRHDCFLRRCDFAGFVDAGISITDGVTEMAQIDWDAAISALHAGQLCASGGDAGGELEDAPFAAGTPVSLHDAIPGLDNRNLQLLITAIKHAAGQRPPHP